MTLLRDRREAIGMAVGAVMENIGLVARLATSVFLLTRVHPALVLLPLFAIPSVWTGAIGARWVIKAFERSAEPRRRADLLYELGTSPGPAKEIRIFGTAETMIRRHSEDLEGFDSSANAARARAAGLSSLGWLVFAAAYIGTLILVAREAVQGRATAGDVALAMTLAGQVNGQVTGFVQTVTWALDTLRTVGRYRWLRNYARDHAAPPATVDVPDRIRDGIRFESVDFTYPGTSKPVLRGVDLSIPAGSTVAIVGDNGAGKSTIVKLLGRYYEPTEGRILVDGRQLSGMDPELWRSRMSAAFQDHARYELQASEVVGVGWLPALQDRPAIQGALERASAEDVAAGLASGLDTNLGRTFEDGIELSGGQWQKLALGRGMMRAEPLLLVLDEPTASLDADTEHALFERYAAAATRVGREVGAITLFVSHRFSTVRMADLIIVIDDGQIVEAGSHEQLVARDGLYAELYEIQARQYR
ncbi:MAG: ABC transporter ATP-binding protein [Actinomycetota bacterium]